MNIRTLIFLVLAFTSQVSVADYDINEGRVLALMVEELDFLIETARNQSELPPKNDLVFGFDVLADDLLRIRELIRIHMENASKSPNQISPQTSGVDPVQGMYSQRKY